MPFLGDYPKVFFKNDLPKVVRTIAETNKARQSLNQRFHQSTSTQGRHFYLEVGLPVKRKALAVLSVSLPAKYAQKTLQPIPKHLYARSHAKQHCEMVSDIESKFKVLNTENKASSISKHIKAREEITSDQWVIDTVTGAEIGGPYKGTIWWINTT